MKEKIGIIGFGNMGSAIAERIKNKYQVYVLDKDKNKTKDLSGIKVAMGYADLLNNIDAVLLAIKPQDFGSALKEIRDCASGKLIISIAAGITTDYIEKNLPKTRVIRVMPNIGAKIGDAESSLCAGKTATQADRQQAKELFNCIGQTWEVPEKMIDAATAICGSGPAYIFYDMEKNHIDSNGVGEEVKKKYINDLEIAAERVGFDPEIASKFAAAVTGTSINLINQTGLSPRELRELVASKGGTTEAALKVLFAGGNWSDAAMAALQRAEQLSKKE